MVPATSVRTGPASRTIPGKPGDNYSASLVTTVDVTVRGATSGVVDRRDSVVVLVEVLCDALGSAEGALSLDGLVRLRSGDTLLGTERVHDGVADFELPADRLGPGEIDLAASFVPDEGSHFAASEAIEAVTVGRCDGCTDDEVSLTGADQLPTQGDRAWPWMAPALVVLLAGGALLWLLAGGPSRRAVRRR